jgi:hypothetical protein
MRMVNFGELGNDPRMKPRRLFPARLVTRFAAGVFLVATCVSSRTAPAQHAKDAEGITWLVEFDGKALPDPALWKAQGNPKATLAEGAMHLVDDSTELGAYRASWPAGGDQEIIVEAKVQVGAMTGAIKGKTTMSVWPWRDGAPIGCW